MLKILIIDNHDSFVYNLVQLVRESKESCHFCVVKPEELGDIRTHSYDGLLISPGPGLPHDFPATMETLADFVRMQKPVLGICLGCQAIAQHFGYGLKQLERPLHGHTSYLRHRSRGLLSTLPQLLPIARYHSWVVDLNHHGTDAPLQEEAYTEDIDGRHTMILSHRQLPIWGILFHPESYISANGSSYIEAWLDLCWQYASKE